jgi:Ca2+-binding RTX toxin-like protein
MKKRWLLVVAGLVAACSSTKQEGERVGAASEAVSLPEPPCRSNLQTVTLTHGDDVRFYPNAELCVLGLEGRDVISISGRMPEVISGEGDDVVTLSSGGLVSAGAGNDVIYALGGGGELRGGDGDDVIISTGGHSLVVPGAGSDYVSLGPGDDYVGIFDLCDAQPGELLDAGDGFDTLFTTIPLAKLEARGVKLLGFEELQFVHGGHASACGASTAEDATIPDGGVSTEQDGGGGGVPGCDTCSSVYRWSFPTREILNPVLEP